MMSGAQKFGVPVASLSLSSDVLRGGGGNRTRTCWIDAAYRNREYHGSNRVGMGSPFDSS